MDLLEYQGKELLARYGLPTTVGKVALSADEAVAAASHFKLPVVVKAQVHTGGRGKAGGIRLANDLEEVREHAADILGLDINGHTVKQLWVEQAADIAEEYYASFTLDRSAKQHLGILSAEGGVEIETVAEENPDAIAKILVNPLDGLTESTCRAWVEKARINKAAVDKTTKTLISLYDIYIAADAELLEINPLVLTEQGDVVALDAKVSVDANSAFRHESYTEYEKTQVKDDREHAAHAQGLIYVGLEGSVGVIANGAGLAMSTVDMVHQVGGKPANFLDLGGGADADVMTAALEVLNDDPTVKSILVNVFGGITRCEDVANGIIEAFNRVDIKSPIVARFDGTTVEEGRKLMEPHISPMLVMANDMLEAARLAVELAEPGATRRMTP